MTQPLTLFLMLGYPGSGKTTAAKVLHELTGADHLWADHERRLRFRPPTYTHAENLTLYAELNIRASELLGQGRSVVYDTNFNFYDDRQKLRQIAQTHKARVLVVWVRAPKELARERATQNAHRQETRVLGDMPVERFEHISRNLDPPHAGEEVIELDGTQITPENVRAALQQHGV